MASRVPDRLITSPSALVTSSVCWMICSRAQREAGLYLLSGVLPVAGRPASRALLPQHHGEGGAAGRLRQRRQGTLTVTRQTSSQGFLPQAHGGAAAVNAEAAAMQAAG